MAISRHLILEGMTGDEALFVYAGRAKDHNLARDYSSQFDYRSTQTALKATIQSYMINPECGRWLEDPALIKEGAQRGARRYFSLREGGEATEEQVLLDQLGAELREIRYEQERALSEVATIIGIEPARLCFLESGWATKDEYVQIIQTWSVALDVDTTEYKQRLGMPMNDGIKGDR